MDKIRLSSVASIILRHQSPGDQFGTLRGAGGYHRPGMSSPPRPIPISTIPLDHTHPHILLALDHSIEVPEAGAAA